MAAGYGCANDECQRPVNWLITHLNPPLTLSTCDEDSPVFLIPILAAELGVDADKLYDAIRRHVDKEAKATAKAAAAAEVPEAGKELDPFTEPRPCEVCGEMLEPAEAHLHFGTAPASGGEV